MIRQTNAKSVPLTPELAEEFATMPSWVGERPLRPSRVDMLRGKIDQGLFHSPTWALAKLGARHFRMNGQHSSNALCQASAFPQGLRVSILEFSVDSELDLAQLFSQFDNQDSARRSLEVINAHARTMAEYADISNGTLQTILGGISMGLTPSGNPSGTSSEDKARLLHAQAPFISFAREFASTRMLGCVSVTAAVFRTWRRDPVRAGQFWSLVENQSHPDPNNATRALSRFLGTEVCGKRSGTTWDRRAVMVKCLHAWNAYWRGAPTSLRYVAEAPVPPAV